MTLIYGYLVLLYEVVWFMLLLASLLFDHPLAVFIANITGRAVSVDPTYLSMEHVFPLWNTMAWGGIGGVVGSLYSLYWHAAIEQDFKQYLMWYIVQPIMGVILGGIVYLIIASVFIPVQMLVAQFTHIGEANQIMANPAVKAFRSVIACAAGFRQRFVFEILDRVLMSVIGRTNPTPGIGFVDKRTLPRDEIIAHIRDRLLAARDDIVGIILFGSFARGEAWHDIDVLVVLRERVPTRKAWAAVMRQCQDAIGLYNLDVIPTYLDGLRQGLAEHVCILMDVAFDGLVIYGGETVERLLREAREEITARGIQQTDTGGWRFPVKYRQSTPLSLRTNSERAQRWLEDARREIEVADQIEQSGHFDRCVYHCQQSIERTVKAVLICFGAFERVHWVGGILEQELSRQDVGPWKKHLLRLARLSKDMEHAAVDARYIIEDETGESVWIPSEHYFQPEATAALDAAHQALTIASDFVAWWFDPDEGN